jgi:hypothetical protein
VREGDGEGQRKEAQRREKGKQRGETKDLRTDNEESCMK